MTAGSSGSFVASPPITFGLAKFTERYTRSPYGRNTSASAATLRKYSGRRMRGLAFTLLSTVPLMPSDALARA
jgi:hypothetical protein